MSGHEFIREALQHEKQPKLTLYVRNRSKLPPKLPDDDRIRIVEGQLNDTRALTEAMTDAVAVVSFLGAYPSLKEFVFRMKNTPIGDSFTQIFEAMRAKGVTRILALSTWPGIRSPEEEASMTVKWRAYRHAVPTLIPQSNQEMVRIAEQLSSQNDLEWTVFRVPLLLTGHPEKKVFAGMVGKEYQGGMSLDRGSQARWVLTELDERKWIKGYPMLGNC